jgi:hypothetical protein
MALTLPSESTESWATRGKKGLVIFTDLDAVKLGSVYGGRVVVAHLAVSMLIFKASDRCRSLHG